MYNKIKWKIPKSLGRLGLGVERSQVLIPVQVILARYQIRLNRPNHVYATLDMRTITN